MPAKCFKERLYGTTPRHSEIRYDSFIVVPAIFLQIIGNGLAFL
jgi:hypothetical protein